MIDSDLVLSDIGIYIMDSQKDNEIFQKLEALAQPLLQNDKADFLDLIQMFKAISVEDLERNIESGIKRKAEAQAQQAQAEQQIAQEQIALEREKMDREDYNKEQDRQVKITVAEIQAFSRQDNLDTDMDGIPDPVEIASQALEERKQNFAEYTESTKIAQEREMKEKELSLKEKELNSKAKVEQLKIKQTEVQNKSQEKMQQAQIKAKEKELAMKEKIERLKIKNKPKPTKK
jgi:hypothetical protein